MPIAPSRQPPARRSKAARSGPKISAEVRKLARDHTKAAVAALAEIATKGTSEASRIAAAMALLDRGYGKAGPGPAPAGGAHSPILYHWIELIDGTADQISPRDPTLDDDTRNHKARSDQAEDGQD